jgi:hypothetical protein
VSTAKQKTIEINKNFQISGLSGIKCTADVTLSE